jgi:hypothetical protein
MIVQYFGGAYLPLRKYGADIERDREGWWNAADVARAELNRARGGE